MKQIPTTETPRLLQDEAEGYETQRLSKWFASRIDARETIRRNKMKMVWILWSNDMFSSKVKHDDKQGVHIVELFAHKIDAEAFMRICREEDDPIGGRYWIQEREVK